jgi:hypothetical protein
MTTNEQIAAALAAAGFSASAERSHVELLTQHGQWQIGTANGPWGADFIPMDGQGGEPLATLTTRIPREADPETVAAALVAIFSTLQ